MTMLQNGIYWRGGKPNNYRLLLINIRNGISSADARKSLSELWDMLKRLELGEVNDLRKELRPGDPDVVLDNGDLQTLIGFGARLFDESVHSPPLVKKSQQPRRLKYLRVKNPSEPFNRLKWRDPDDPLIDPSNPVCTQSDLAIQFTGNSDLAVNRAIVEVQKAINDLAMPFNIVHFFSGFKREDRRSWIDFHDGINNMTPPERLAAMEVRGGDVDWLNSGTYMSFFRIHIDLEIWRTLPRHFQELIVGRDKLTACPITDSTRDDVEGDARPVFQGGCPVSDELPNKMHPEFQAPPQPSDAIVQAAHIYRANLNRGSPVQTANSRIYRQGYEFVEPDANGGILLGLNFVGFHRSIEFVTDILRQAFWMGDANFGGLENANKNTPPSLGLMQLLHGCYFGVPAMADPFPGAELFNSDKKILLARSNEEVPIAESRVRTVKGVGRVYERLLNGAKVRTVADLASIGDIADLHEPEIPEIFRIASERGWVKEARKLV